MSRGRKIAAIIAGSLLGLIVVVVIAGIVIVRTQWFADFVRQKIVASVEDATGGTAQIGGFSFDWTHLRADVNDFVLHGLEPKNGPPLFQAKLIEVELKLLSPFRGFVDIASLLVDTPQANVIVFPDGRTNVPAPKVQKPSDKSGLETVVNLAIGKFDLRNGSLTVANRQTNFGAAGEHLLAHLDYNTINPSYKGELDMSPLDLKTGNNPMLAVNVKLPVTLEKDKITLANAQLTTPESQIVVSGSMEHMMMPSYLAHVNARVALDEAKRAAGLTMPLDTRRGPRILNADVTASMDDNRVQIQNLQLTLGHSNIEASGTLKDANKAASLQLNSMLALGELSTLLRTSTPFTGTADLGAKVAMQGNRIDVTDLRLAALGGSFTGSGSLENMAQYRLAGTLHDFDIAQVARPFVKQSLGYDGIVSGTVDADGNLKAASSLMARANLAIAPGRRGIPVSGRLNVDYNEEANNVTLGQSYLALPNSRIDLSGSLGRQIQVRMVTRNASDFRPVAMIPVTFQNGGAALNATVSGSLNAPRIAGHLDITNFAVDGRPFTSFVADLNAARTGVAVSNAALRRGPLQADLSASVGLRNWKPLPVEPVRVDATVRNADLRDILALAGQSSVPANGAFTADARITGTIGSPQGNADFTVANGSIEGQPFDQLSARANMSDRSIDVPALQLIAGPSRIDANATYQHTVNDLQRGTLRAHVASNQVQLAQFQSLVKDRPGLRGVLSLNGDAVANLEPVRGSEEFNVSTLNANFAVRGLEMQGKKLGDLTATANTAGQAVQYNVNSDFAGSTIRVNGQSLLTGNHDTTATASIANLPLPQVLAVAGRSDLKVGGVLAADAKLSGTLQDPHADANITVTKGMALEEPVDRVQVSVTYTNQLIDIPSLRITSGPSDLELSASFAHPANDFSDGQARFRVRTNQIQLARFQSLARSNPKLAGLAGSLQFSADGDATLRRNQVPLFSTLNADLSARGISVNKKPVGDLTATAETRGREVEFNLKSDFAHANINGSGRMQLAGNYPVDARVTFSNVTYGGLSDFTGSAPAGFDASADGQISLAGPAAQTDALRATLQLTKLEAHSASPQSRIKPRVNFDLHNAGPVVVALDHSVVTVQSARLTGQDANLSISGTASLKAPQTVNLRTDGNVRLELLEAFSPNIFSSGAVTLNAAVTGTTAQPVVNGRLQLQNASFNMLSLPNGISNANGSIAFNGTEAMIENITGQSGGGKITLAGYVVYGGPEMRFRITAGADQVHIDYPDSVTTEASAQLVFAGTTSSSLLSGNVTILDVALHSSSDVGSILSQAATPPATPTASTGLAGGIRFDVRIQTSPDTQFRTTLTENLQADADLTMRGTIDHPGMLGRVSITQGDVVFFGSKYTIDQGTLSFYDPNKINPILNIDLETTAQGIDVSLSVSGPLDRMKLSYRSDPPLQFSDIVSLLASGKVPTSDPVLASRQPPAPQQSFTQLGASALLGQAVANPVSGRLQRLFGVTKLKIDPQITGATNTPQATLTLQQQITKDITFTYMQDVTQSNPQTLRIEWAVNPQWSAIAQRDVYGELDLDFYYKKRFW